MMQAQLQAKIDAAMQRKDWPTAGAALREFTKTFPGSMRACIELSYVESFQGHYRAAAAAISAVNYSPGASASDTTDFIARLRTFNDACRLRELSRILLQAPNPDAGSLSACAMQLSNLNDHALALECAQKAVTADPAGIGARLTRGQMLVQHGAVDLAEADFDWCLARVPGLTPAWWALSRLRRQTTSSNHLPALRRALAVHGLGAADIAYASFALHKELDDIGDVDGAWQALEQACRAKRSTLRYDRTESRALIDALIKMPVVAGDTPASTSADSTPIFIVGMHRSGTTLLEQLLDGNPQILGVGELYDFTSVMRHATDHHCKGVIDYTIVERASRADFANAGRRYLDGMAWRLGEHSHFTDKLPSNFLNIGFISQALPQARILHMVRDPLETCFSNLRELFSDANPYSYDQAELADYYLQYQRLMAHWHQKFPGRILDVDYAELTADTEGTMRKVAAFCGLEYTEAMRDPRSSRRAVATASAMQVRDAVVRRRQPKWAPYREQLQPLVKALQDGGVVVGDAAI